MPSRAARDCWSASAFLPRSTAKRCARGPALLQELLRDAFSQCDVLHVPVLKRPVPTAAETDVGGSPACSKCSAQIVANTRPINFLGLPGLSVPIGLTRNGLPQAMQLVGRPFREDFLFRIGAAYEAAAPADARERPPLQPIEPMVRSRQGSRAAPGEPSAARGASTSRTILACVLAYWPP